MDVNTPDSLTVVHPWFSLMRSTNSDGISRNQYCFRFCEDWCSLSGGESRFHQNQKRPERCALSLDVVDLL